MKNLRFLSLFIFACFFANSSQVLAVIKKKVLTTTKAAPTTTYAAPTTQTQYSQPVTTQYDDPRVYEEPKAYEEPTVTTTQYQSPKGTKTTGQRVKEGLGQFAKSAIAEEIAKAAIQTTKGFADIGREALQEQIKAGQKALRYKIKEGQKQTRKELGLKPKPGEEEEDEYEYRTPRREPTRTIPGTRRVEIEETKIPEVIYIQKDDAGYIIDNLKKAYGILMEGEVTTRLAMNKSLKIVQNLIKDIDSYETEKLRGQRPDSYAIEAEKIKSIMKNLLEVEDILNPRNVDIAEEIDLALQYLTDAKEILSKEVESQVGRRTTDRPSPERLRSSSRYADLRETTGREKFGRMRAE
ncbi:MAG: hypothetical protein WC436_02440 [Candidatus Babeliales bacterium]